MRIRIIFLTLKNLQFFYFIPLLVLWVFIPISNFLDIQSYGLEDARVFIMNTTQWFIPIVSTWWVFCVLKEYIEGYGRELFYVYENRKQTKISDVMIVLLWYLLHTGVLFAVYALFYNHIILDFIMILIQCFVLTSAFYALSVLLKSTSMPYMFILIYFMMTLFFSKDTIFEWLTIFSLNEEALFYFTTKKYLIVFAAGILFFFIGYCVNRRYHRFLDTD